ncbi:NAD(P)H-binding protein [Vibrio astriarenae]|uniref:NAD(P)H-binding protein n=2 Tax=Vibrio astriarenae TaxID=1481923 RepID=A0A7Z2T5X8_9VIBR|nr:NAD(P)H-binding protein [Vibrio astriarenae]
MGVYLQSLLTDNGYEVTVTSRSSKTSENVNVKFIQGNAQDDDFIDEVLTLGWDVVVDFMIYSTSSFEKKVDKLLKYTKQYVYLSSARVYADSNGKITENSSRLLDVSKDTEFLATDEYALAKARQENILYSSKAKNWTIVRPYITYGDNRLQLGVLEKESWLYRALKGKTIVFSKEMCGKRTTITSGYDVAKAISSLLGREGALGEVFHITSNESTSWEEVLTLYCEEIEKQLGFRPKVLLQDLPEFSSHHASIYQIRYDRFYNRTFDNSKIERFIDVNDFTSYSEGLKACLNTFVYNPKFLAINWRSEAIKDKYAGEYTRLSEIDGVKNKLKYIYFRFIK